MAIEKEGLGYRSAIPGEGIELSVDRLTEARGELYGELTVVRAPEGHLMRSRLSLSSSNSRHGAATYLMRRAHGLDWHGILETFCVDVLTAERAGSPVVRIGRLPPRPAVDFLLEPLLPIGKPTILYGQEGTGKSTVAALLAVAVASGVPTFSRWTVREPSAVLVLDWEADADDWNDLIAAAADGIGIEPPEVAYVSCAGPLTGEIYRIASQMAQYERWLLIVDSVGLASPAMREGSDAAEGALRLFGALRTLGCTSLLIDHVNKSDETGTNSRPYGSVYKPALARATYELRAAEEADVDGTRHLALFHRKGNSTRRQAPVGIKLYRDQRSILATWEPVMVADAAIAKGSTLIDRVRDLLRSGPLTVREMAETLNASDGVIKAMLNHRKTEFVSSETAGREKRWAMKSDRSDEPPPNRNPVTEHVTPGSVTTVPPLKGGRETVLPSHPRPFDVLEGLSGMEAG